MSKSTKMWMIFEGDKAVARTSAYTRQEAWMLFWGSDKKLAWLQQHNRKTFNAVKKMYKAKKVTVTEGW